MSATENNTDNIDSSMNVDDDNNNNNNESSSSSSSNIIASIFKFEKMKGLITPEKGEHVEVSSDELKSPKVNLD